MKIKKIHRVLSFYQKAWMKPYIDFNTSKRMEADKIKNSFLTNFYKLMNNIVFGKTMENVRHHRNVCLINNAEKLKKLYQNHYLNEQ